MHSVQGLRQLHNVLSLSIAASHSAAACLIALLNQDEEPEKTTHRKTGPEPASLSSLRRRPTRFPWAKAPGKRDSHPSARRRRLRPSGPKGKTVNSQTRDPALTGALSSPMEPCKTS